MGRPNKQEVPDSSNRRGLSTTIETAMPENTRSRWSPVGLVHVVPYLSLKTKLQCRLVNNEFNRLLLRNPQTKKQLRLAFDWRLNEMKRLTRAEMANGYYFEVAHERAMRTFESLYIRR